MSTPLPSPIAEAVRASVGQRLLKAARLLDERAVARLASHPQAPPLRTAHTRLFPHLDAQGTRGSVLAERMGISKQAVSKLVNELMDWGVLEQVPDPDDGRASLIRLTPAGLNGIGVGLAVLAELEDEVREQVGEQAMAGFATVLDAWIRTLSDPEPGADPNPD